MSDIQEEQKRLYKRAEEIDKEQEINNKFSRIVREKMKDKSAVEMIVLQDEEINKYKQALLDIKEIINEQINYNFSQYAVEKMLDEIMETINKKLGDNK